MESFTTDGKICIERAISKLQIEDIQDFAKAFDLSQTSAWICDNKFNTVCLQFPDELLPHSVLVYEELKQRTKADLYILGDTSYSSCCIDEVAAMHVNADAIIHYGHTCFSAANIPVYLVLPKKEFDVNVLQDCIERDFPKEGRFCLFYDCSFDHCKSKISEHWFAKYPESYIAIIEPQDFKDKIVGRVIKDKNAQTVGTDQLKECQCIFLGLRGQTLFNYVISAPAQGWYLLDPERKLVEMLDETPWFKRRRFLIEKCKDANIIGILVCKLSGKYNNDIISRIKNICKARIKKSYIISVGKPNVAKLANFPEVDIYVMVACPENDLYSNRDFYKPIVYPFELEVALNQERPQFNDVHVTDFEQLLPGHNNYHQVSEKGDNLDVSLITGKIRDSSTNNTVDQGNGEVAEKQNWALENIGQNLVNRSWAGLEQKLGETEVKQAEQGRKGIPVQYKNEPE